MNTTQSIRWICGHCKVSKLTELGLCTSCGRFSTKLSSSKKGTIETYVRHLWRKGK